jgi:norsolorinic acid ketoreductase
MASNTTYLITGANRGSAPITPILTSILGNHVLASALPLPPLSTQLISSNIGIGFGLTRSLLLRPNTTVVATIRSAETSTEGLKGLAVGQGSKLLIVPFTLSLSSLATATASLLAVIAENRIKKIDNLILTAGTGSSFRPILSTTMAEMQEHFEANTLLPIHLFQTLFPLLSPTAKVILISSSLGSIAGMEGAAPSLAYGVSKAGANYFVRKVHFESEGIVAVAVHPGYVPPLFL